MEKQKECTSCDQQMVLIPKNDIKEEKIVFDNSPYGQMIPEVKKKNVHKPPLSLDDYWFNGSFRRCNTRGISRLQQEVLHTSRQRCSCIAGDF
jgi:hypothetical protein